MGPIRTHAGMRFENLRSLMALPTELLIGEDFVVSSLEL